MTIVYELRDSFNRLLAREFEEANISRFKIAVENAGYGRTTLTKLFCVEDIEDRVIDTIYKAGYLDELRKKFL